MINGFRTGFSKNLLLLMQEERLSLTMLAERGGVSHATLLRWIKGGRPNMRLLHKFCQNVGVEVKDIWPITTSANS